MDTPVPLGTVSLVDHVIFDIIPDILCRLEIFFLCRIFLVSVQKTNYGFRLYPPYSGGIIDTVFTLVHKRMVAVCCFVYICKDFFCDGRNLCGVRRIIQHFKSTVNQPGSFNIMSIGVKINKSVPLSVKKYFLSFLCRVIYLVCKNIQHKTGLPRRIST